MENLKRNTHYNRIKEIILNEGNNQINLNTCEILVERFSKRFKTVKLTTNLTELIEERRTALKKSIKFGFVSEVECK